MEPELCLSNKLASDTHAAGLRTTAGPNTMFPYWIFASYTPEIRAAAAAAAKSLQSCPTLCDPIDGSPPGKNTGVGCHFLLQCMKVKSESEVSHSCLTLSDPMDCSLPGCSIHGIFQARVLEWVAIAFSARDIVACNCPQLRLESPTHTYSSYFLRMRMFYQQRPRFETSSAHSPDGCPWTGYLINLS